ncbi:MAG: hypothetical protein CMF62_02400 [Magnetococcales bacterium]|nr:hypothetical protein [Magnetococcales bacterium]
MFRLYNGYFVDKKIILIYVLLLLLVMGFGIFQFNKKVPIQKCPMQKCPMIKYEQTPSEDSTTVVKQTQPIINRIQRPINPINQINPINRFDHIIDNPEIDPISSYDYDKVFDPLTFPNRRVQKWELPPPQLKAMIDIHTQGYPDSFRQLGVLVRETKGNDEFQQNQVLRLYGRELYPKAERYEYYTEMT